MHACLHVPVCACVCMQDALSDGLSSAVCGRPLFGWSVHTCPPKKRRRTSRHKAILEAVAR